MSEHFTLDELAELDAGLLARRRAAAAERHLADCGECSARADALRKTGAALADLGPVQMPPEVAARIDRAIRDAAATSATDVVPDLSAARERRLTRLPRWTYAAAAAVVAAAIVGIVLGTGGNKNEATIASRPPIVPTSAPSALVQSESGQTYTPATLAAIAPGLVNGSPARADSAAGSQLNATSGGGASSGQPYATSKSAAPPAPVGHQPGPATAEAPMAASKIAPSLQKYVNSRSTLLHCAAFISDTQNAMPLAVDFGRWTNAKAGIHNVPALILVFGDNEDPNSLDVFVVAAPCDDSSLLDFKILSKS